MSLGCDIVFCRRCGAFSVGRVNHLYSFPTVLFRSSTSKNTKSRLLDGMHPVSGEELGIPLPLIRYFKTLHIDRVNADDDITSICMMLISFSVGLVVTCIGNMLLWGEGGFNITSALAGTT